MTGRRFGSLGGAPVAIAGAALLTAALTMAPAPLVGAATPTTQTSLVAGDTALIMGGTGSCCVTSETPWGLPGPPYTTFSNRLFIAPHHPGYTPIGLAAPQQLAPITGLDSLPFGTSLQQGTDILDTAIHQAIGAGNNVVAFGYSQSSTIITRELDYLATLPADQRPSPEELAFVMIGNGNNPDGGLLARFPGAYIASLDANFSGATPDDVYPAAIYTAQYDGWGDFPKYPLNILASLNAFAGIAYAHGLYMTYTPEQIGDALANPLPTVGDTMTDYYRIPTENLPLLEPVRSIPVVGQPLAELLQPSLRVLIELGYDRTGPANVPTSAELFPTDVNAITVVSDLLKAAVLGLNNALTNVGLPDLLPLITGLITDVAATLDHLAGQIDPVIQAVGDSLRDALNSVTIPAQLADALGSVAGAVSAMDIALSQLINDEIYPAIQAAVYGIGDPLRDALTSMNAPEQLADGVYLLEQVIPIVLGGPGSLLTNSVHFLATGLEELAANNFGGFIEQLELIPAGVTTLSLFTGLLPVLGLMNLLEGVPLSI